jgi:formate hydrogenlyase subunit 6/NADH:ubiquinone oxidoreductase subunit I
MLNSAKAAVNITDCFGCAFCGIICPDAAIEIYRDIDIVAVESEKKDDRPSSSTPR